MMDKYVWIIHTFLIVAVVSLAAWTYDLDQRWFGSHIHFHERVELLENHAALNGRQVNAIIHTLDNTLSVDKRTDNVVDMQSKLNCAIFAEFAVNNHRTEGCKQLEYRPPEQK
jgi:hypothetical protein